MKAKKGFFITFEGCEGCGKSTHAFLFYRYLVKKGIKAVFTREPGGTGISRELRRILLNPRTRIDPLTELFLYEADRSEHVKKFVLPALVSGKTVVCDRYTDSTVAYQGYGRGINVNLVKRLNDSASLGLKPDLTVYLDIPVEEGVRRAKIVSSSFFKKGDRLERELMSFHRLVRKGFLALARANPARIKTVRTAADISSTQKQIVNIAKRKLNIK
ncbi:MAG: dTMP kinase [Endomicrobiales bacterium]|nr:dTMP kinase [Endomicrobiales bacterium]